MRRNYLKIAAIMLLLAGVVSCQSKSEADQPVTALKGTKWKLVGIVDETGILKVLDPKDCEKCYTLVWSVDDKVTAHIMNGDILELDLLNLNPAYTEDRLYPEFYPIYGDFYSDCMCFRSNFIATESYAATVDELKLYCVDTNKSRYMLFKPF